MIVTIPVVVVSSGFDVVSVDVSVTDDVVGASLAVVGVTSVGLVTDVVPVGSDAVDVVTNGASEAVTDGAVDAVTYGLATNMVLFTTGNIHYYAHIKTASCRATCPLTLAKLSTHCVW